MFFIELLMMVDLMRFLLCYLIVICGNVPWVCGGSWEWVGTGWQRRDTRPRHPHPSSPSENTARKCWDGFAGTYFAEGETVHVKGRGFFSCVNGRKEPRACDSKESPGRRVEFGQGEKSDGFVYFHNNKISLFLFRAR